MNGHGFDDFGICQSKINLADLTVLATFASYKYANYLIKYGPGMLAQLAILSKVRQINLSYAVRSKIRAWRNFAKFSISPNSSFSTHWSTFWGPASRVVIHLYNCYLYSPV